MKESVYKTYEELPLVAYSSYAPVTPLRAFPAQRETAPLQTKPTPLGFRLGQEIYTVAKALGVSPSTGYELLHEKDFPALKIGNRIVVPKQEFIGWVEQNTGGKA